MHKGFRKLSGWVFSWRRLVAPALCCLLAAIVPSAACALEPPAAGVAARADAPPPDNDFWQSGFQAGMLGALKDLENHRQPDPNNRDEYRHPSAPYAMRDTYREGFRHGYNAAVSKLTSSDFRSWVEGLGGEARRQGFRDGVAGAIKDFGNHRRPDPDNRDEYRHPSVPYAEQQHYRDGFERGYRWAMSQLMGDNHR